MSQGFASPARAWLRAIPDSLARCLRENDAPIDVDLARAQHRAYALALEAAGVAVRTLPAEESCPDCVYVEDVALLLGPLALATRPGAPPRRPEVAPVADALAQAMPLVTMRAPATLDGGDVLRVGQRLFVGLSARTNADGARALAEHAAPLGLEVVPVPVQAGLHLKSAITLVTPGLVVLTRGPLDPRPFREVGLEVLLTDEPLGGNVLALSDRVLVSAGAPALAETLQARGLAVVLLDISELHKGDGALTCLSLRQPPPGAWCA